MVRRKRGFAVALATLGTAALLVSGCTSSGKSENGTTGAAKTGSSQDAGGGTGTLAGFKLASYISGHVKDKKKLKIVYITNDLSSSYTSAQKAGVEKATADLGVDAELQGPPTGKAEDQVALIQTLIAQKKVDGIVVAAVNVDSLKPVIQQAFEAGIPFISAFTDQPNSKQLAFVGADNEKFGEELGKRFAETLKGKSGKVVAISVDTAAGWSTARMDGLKKGLATNPDLKFVGPINTTIEQGQMYNAIQNAMTANPDAIGIASVDCCSIDGAAKWVETNNKIGQVAVTGTDALQQTLNYIKKDVIAFALSQDPVGQVFTSIKQIRDFVVDGKAPQRVIMPALLVDKSNADKVTPEG